MRGDLAGSVAVVTGAEGRLGAIWRAALSGAGAHVVGLDLTVPPDPAAEPPGPDEIHGHRSGRYWPMTADVTDRTSLCRALERCVAEVGQPSILVNNAGVDQPPTATAGSWRFADIPDALSATVLDVNALGALRTCQVFGPALVRRGGGSIVNIGSLYGSVAPDPRMYEHLPLDPPFLKPPSYSMSKAALAALTRYLAVLWGPAGVRVNTLSPGGVRGDQDDDFRVKFADRVPLRRMAEPADLTGPLLFLASEQSRYVTGLELVVDGGFLCL